MFYLICYFFERGGGSCVYNKWYKIFNISPLHVGYAKQETIGQEEEMYVTFIDDLN